MAVRRVIINGKFQAQKTTGVQRVAYALTTGLVQNAAAGSPDTAGLEFAVAVPKGVTNAFSGVDGPPPRLKGVAWEQFELPRQAGHHTLLNFANVGPVSRKGDVVMIHDAQAFISPKSYSAAFGTWYRTILPILASRASRVLTVSEYARQCLAEVGVTSLDRIDVIHNGVDHILDVKSKPAVLARLGLSRRPYIAALGSVQHHKNIQVLTKAAHFFKDDIALVLIGAATQADYEAAGISLSSNTILAGRLSDEEMKAVVEGAVAFGFPSITEGFGLPPLEAMLLGIPAIVAPCGSMLELCGNAAKMVSPDDPEAWADAVEELTGSDTQRLRYAQAGKAQAAKYTWEGATQKLAGILQSVT